MAIDMSRIASAAIEAAFDDGKPRRRFSGLRAVAAGAVLAAAARVAVSRAPDLPGLTDLPRVPDRLRDELAERGWLRDDEEPEDVEPVEKGSEEEAYEDEEPKGAEDEDEQDYEDEEPEGEADEEPEGEPAAAGDGANRRTAAPNVMDALSEPRSLPPVLSRLERRERRRVDPAARPPEPPESEAPNETQSKSGGR